MGIDFLAADMYLCFGFFLPPMLRVSQACSGSIQIPIAMCLGAGTGWGLLIWIDLFKGSLRRSNCFFFSLRAKTYAHTCHIVCTYIFIFHIILHIHVWRTRNGQMHLYIYSKLKQASTGRRSAERIMRMNFCQHMIHCWYCICAYGCFRK